MKVHGLRGARISALAVLCLSLGCEGGSRSTPLSPPPPSPPPPATVTVTSISPNVGSIVGTSVVTITGTGFQSGATASLGGITIRITQVTATTIVGTSGAHAPGPVDVVVTNPGGQSATLAGGFTYAVLPYAITSSASTVAPGGTLIVTWTAPTGGYADWVGLFLLTDPSTNYANGWWEYTWGSATGTYALRAPLQPGVYEFRYLLDDGYVDVARSAPVTVR